MKPHFKTLAIVLLAALIGGCMPALGAVPLRWNVETSRAQPASFDVYRGETLLLTADMTSYGRPLEMAGAAALYIQTNGMADVWWTIPATVATNRIEATLSPTNYPGDAQVLNCYLGGPATSYRAAFRLRVLGAPGPAPETVQFPVRSLDFANVVVSNAPWLPLSNGQTDNLRVTDALYFGAPPTPGVSGFGSQYIKPGDGGLKMRHPDGRSVLILNEGNFGEYLYGAIGEDFEWMYETVEGLQTDAEQIMPLAQAVTNLSNTIAAWQTYWDGDDVRVTVTNYYGSLDIPSLYLEQRMPADGDHSEPWFRTVWDERTRWEDFLATNNLWKADVAESLGQKADRAWGHYDSHTGGWSPDGYTQVSSSNILIAAGMAYQRHVVTEGAVWLLESNGLVTNLGGDADSGFFKIQDDDGNAMFEIVKGNRREVGANANSLTSEVVNGVTHLTVTYNVVSAEHPKLYTTHDLGQTFVAEDDASSPVVTSWTGSSGAWVCEFHYKASVADKSRLFAKAGYTTGGETMIRQSVPVEMGSIILNDTKYYLGTATISGHTVLTLRTTP